MSSPSEASWIVRQYERRARSRTALESDLAAHLIAASSREQMLEQLLQEGQRAYVECLPGGVANPTEVALSLALNYKNQVSLRRQRRSAA